MITISTDTPDELLEAIVQGIDNKRIQTWEYDDDGDFTHSAAQWNRRAWLRPTIELGTLVLSIIAPLETNLSEEVYAIYHGRFIEMMLAHFDSEFSQADATAMPTASDVVAA